jgi:hypothetical protein
MSNCKSDALPPLYLAVIAASKIMRITTSIDLFRLLPIWPSGKSRFSSAASVISRADKNKK